MNKFLFNLLYVLLIVGVLAFCVWFGFWLTGESGQCLKDPMKYYGEITNAICYCGNATDITKNIVLNLSA